MRVVRETLVILRATTVAGSLLFVLVTLVAIGDAGAQSGSVTTPKPGSAERKAIMEGLRVPIERKLHQKVIFVVSRLSVKGSWAFTITIPKQPNGKNVDYQKTIYRDEVKPGQASCDTVSGEVIGLLKKQGKRWKAVDFCIGPSDVCWDGWDKKYGAPSAIMR